MCATKVATHTRTKGSAVSEEADPFRGRCRRIISHIKDKMTVDPKTYILYLARWQLSTPILALVLIGLSSISKWNAVVIANLVGGLIFFWVDRIIFSFKTKQN